MKSTIIQLFLIILIGISTPARAEQVANIDFVDEQGKTHHLHDFLGSRILLHFWATWCEPCVEELPELNTMSKMVYAPYLKIIPIAINGNFDSTEKIRQFMDKFGIDHIPLYRASPKQSYATDLKLGKPILPFSILIDEQGHQIRTFPGPYRWSNQDLQHYILNLKTPPKEIDNPEKPTEE